MAVPTDIELHGAVEQRFEEVLAPAALEFVALQRDDRQGEIARLARRLRASGCLRPGVSERKALAQLMLLTSYETFRELRRAGLAERELTKTLQDSARRLLVD